MSRDSAAPPKKSWTRLQFVVLTLPFVLMAGVIAYGATLPPTASFARAVELRQTPVAIYSALAGVDGWPRWSSRLVGIERLDTNAWRQTFAGERTARLEQRETTVPTRLTFAIADEEGPYRGTWTFLIEPLADRTRVVLIERASLGNPVSRFLARFAAGKTAFAEDHLHDLARLLGAPGAEVVAVDLETAGE